MRTWAATVLLAIAVVANLTKAIAIETQYLVWPFWSVTYRYGFVRRGLVGTVFHALGFRCDARGLWAVLVAHRFATALLVAGMITWAARVVVAQRRRRRMAVLLGVAAVLLSPLLSTVGQNAGYYDVYLLVIALAGAYAASRDRFLVAGAVSAIGPFVHDAFVFLWLPVLIATFVRGVPLRRFAPLALPFATSLLAQVLHSKEAIDRIVAENTHKEQLEIAYRFDVSWFAERMRWLFAQHVDQVVLATLMFGAPALVAVAFAKRAGVRRRYAIACALAPCSILFIAWDLSRFLVWSSFGVFVALVTLAGTAHLHREGAALRPPRFAVAALVLLAFVATGAPHLYAYFHVAYADYVAGPSIMRFSPGAHVARAWLRVFNRKQYTTRFSSSFDSAACLLEPWDARREGDACAFLVDARSRVESPLLWLRKGTYDAHLRLTPAARCSRDEQARARVVARGYGRFAAPERSIAVELERGVEAISVRLPFTIDDEQEAIGRERIVVIGERGCFRLESLRISPAHD